MPIENRGRTTWGTQGVKICETEEGNCALKTYSINRFLREIKVDNIQIPEYQRDLIKEKTKDIYKDLRKNYKRRSNYLLIGDPIKVARYNDTNFVIDGQHRIEAMKLLKRLESRRSEEFGECTKVIKVNCMFIAFIDQEEAEDYYRKINIDRQNALLIKQEYMNKAFDDGLLDCESDTE